MDQVSAHIQAMSDMGKVIKNYVEEKISFSGMRDTPSGYLGHSGDYLVVNDSETGIHFTGIEKIASDLINYGFSAGETAFTGLSDTPDNFNAGKYLRVNDAGDALEYVDITGVSSGGSGGGGGYIHAVFNDDANIVSKSSNWDTYVDSITFPQGSWNGYLRINFKNDFTTKPTILGTADHVGWPGDDVFVQLQDHSVSGCDITIGSHDNTMIQAGFNVAIFSDEIAGGGGGGSIVFDSSNTSQTLSQGQTTIIDVSASKDIYSAYSNGVWRAPHAMDVIITATTILSHESDGKLLSAYAIVRDADTDVYLGGNTSDSRNTQNNGAIFLNSTTMLSLTANQGIKYEVIYYGGDSTHPTNSNKLTIAELDGGGGSGSTDFLSLTDTPVDYIGHSGDYMIVNDNESGIHFTGIEKIASDLTDYGFGGGSSDIPKYTNLPDPTENDGKIVASGCDLYYGCDGEWKKIGAGDIPPPENVPGCVSNLEEYNQYQEYKERFLAENSPQAFDQMLNFNSDITDLIYDVCLFSDSDLSSVKIDETTYKWGMFANTQTVNITATPGVASDREIQFSHWAGDGAVFGDANNSQTTLLVDKDLSVTGYFSEILEATCEDVILHAQSPVQKNLASTAETFQLGSDTIIDNTNTLFGESTYQTTSDSVTVTDMSVTSHLAGTQDFTFETWFRTTDRDADGQLIFEEREVTRNRSMWNWRYRGTQILGKTTGYFAFEINKGDGPTSTYNDWVWTIALTSPVQIENDTWYHLAVVRQNVDNWAFYVNGMPGQVQLMAGDGSANGSLSGSVPVFSGPTELFGGEIGTVTCNFQDFRVSKTAVYTSNFTPPNSLLNNPCQIQPACEDVALHIQSDTTNGSTTFTDLSSNTHTITRFGDTQHSTTDAYLGTTSMVFDGNGDYLQIGDESTFKFLHDGTTDYTVECWVNVSGWGNNSEASDLRSSIIATGGSTTSLGIGLWASSDSFTFRITSGEYQGAPVVNINGGTVNFNTWYHIAVCRNSNTYKLFINGVLVGESVGGSHSTANSHHALRIGRHSWPAGTLQYDGYIQDIRITKKAIYTSNFTPSTTLLGIGCLAEIACEDIALHIQSDTTNGSTSFTDLSSNTHLITRFGDTQHTTANAHLGTTSMSFDGNGDYLIVGNSSDFNFGSSDYTIEFWVNTPNTISSNQDNLTQVIGKHTTTSLEDTAFLLFHKTNEKRFTWAPYGTAGNVSVDIPDNTWVHIAIVRNGSNLRVYKDGVVQDENTSTGSMNNSTATTSIGAVMNNNSPDNTGYPDKFNGYLQDLRITQKAIYTSNFTPPNSLLNNLC